MKTKSAKITSPLSSTLLRADRAMGRIYCFIELKIFDKTVYCISITEGEEFAAELVGEDGTESQRLFDTLCDEGIPPYHLFDIISDIKRESLAKN
ncbi:MAG: hypothetical protein E7642_07570 [Ruminococcaceae bacterium]|nr:hypothetical protein [Oscillospiraceae bacterium]